MSTLAVGAFLFSKRADVYRIISRKIDCRIYIPLGLEHSKWTQLTTIGANR